MRKIPWYPALLLFAVALYGLQLPAAWANEEEKFFSGKRVRILVTVTPGGGYDLYARLVARHLGQHLPGKPSVIVQNMTGGGGRIGTNYAFRVAKPDGLTIGAVQQGIYLDQLTDPAGVEFDVQKFQFIGTPATEVAIGLMRTDKPRTAEALRTSAQPVNIGYSGPGSSFYQFSKLLMKTLGVNLRLIGGYAGAGPIRQAIQQGELDGLIGVFLSSAIALEYQWVKEGFLTPFIQSGAWDPATKSFKRHQHPMVRDVPTVWELAAPEQRRLTTLIGAANVLGRPFVVPPGVPAERVKTLREGFWAAVTSPAFKREATKTFGLEPEPMPGSDLQDLVAEIMKITPSELATLKEVMK
jgi:tripartite-type tricarboxylate transporter receptor subunit TctC